jgi:tripartite-type tricarboxylate transporter receptor subunit TctC
MGRAKSPHGEGAMKPTRWLAAGLLALCAIAGATQRPAFAQSYSARPVKLVVPYPPAGTADIVARLLAEQIGRTGGPAIVIENRPGGGTAIASEAVSRAAPDGSTLLMISPEFVITPHLRKPNYDPLTSFEPICQLVNSPTVIVVNAESPYRTLADLLDAARAKPGEVTMASTGIFQVAIEQLKRAAKANLTYLPYPGNAPASNALLGGHISSLFAVYPTVAELVRSGKLRALAVASLKRIAALPDVPTVIEAGYASYEVESWSGLLAPAKTPDRDILQLASYFTAALEAPEIKSKLVVQDSYAVSVCGADFAAFIRRQYEETGRTIREANFKAQ